MLASKQNGRSRVSSPSTDRRMAPCSSEMGVTYPRTDGRACSACAVSTRHDDFLPSGRTTGHRTILAGSATGRSGQSSRCIWTSPPVELLYRTAFVRRTSPVSHSESSSQERASACDCLAALALTSVKILICAEVRNGSPHFVVARASSASCLALCGPSLASFPTVFVSFALQENLACVLRLGRFFSRSPLLASETQGTSWCCTPFVLVL